MYNALPICFEMEVEITKLLKAREENINNPKYRDPYDWRMPKLRIHSDGSYYLH